METAEVRSTPSPAASSGGQYVEPPWTILCVDDELNIVSALRRVFRHHSYRVFTANSGAEGLGLLERESVDVVISDMRMPEMDGAEFLEQVRNRWPDTVRLLLTGYSDVDSTIGAINRGEIFRYVAKPWDDQHILGTVKNGLERKALEREKRRLEELTQRQNAELRDLNATLEARVLERTAEVRQACDALAGANEKLKVNFLTSIKVFSNLIEMREGNKYAGHSRRVADLARKIASGMGVPARDTQDIFIAGLLHEVGKIGLPEAVLNGPSAALSGERLDTYRKHPVRGAQLLMPLDDLRNAATILRSHRERFDGGGFPEGLAGDAIPLGARILAVTKDYDGAQIGMMSRQRMTPEEAAQLILQGRGKHYDPRVVDAFAALVGRNDVDASAELWVSASELEPAMVLARDLIAADGALLLAADHVLDDALIRRIRDYETAAGKPLAIHVRADKKTEE
jgi:response regulator RpfG family c-di-GMP phosphodiesterase